MNFLAISVRTLTVLSVCIIALSVTNNLSAYAEEANRDDLQNETKSDISPIEPQYVCMINDQSFNKEQIPVEIEGKTYYGCCPMCEGKLKTDPESRTAIDPVSGITVDKASAVIGKQPDGKVFYFESRENMEEFMDKTAGTSQ